jgi:hypothetical protein
MRAPARFPVLKGPIRRQTVRAKQAGHFPLFNCPTLIPYWVASQTPHCLTDPHSSHTELLRNIREMNRIREKRVFSQHSLRALRTITARDEFF